MSLDLVIRTQLAHYLAGASPLDDFQEWFISETWEMEEGSPGEELAQTIELLLAEYTNGDRSTKELREALRPLIFLTPHTAPLVTTASSAVVTKSPVGAGRTVGAGRPPEVVYG